MLYYFWVLFNGWFLLTSLNYIAIKREDVDVYIFPSSEIKMFTISNTHVMAISFFLKNKTKTIIIH